MKMQRCRIAIVGMLVVFAGCYGGLRGMVAHPTSRLMNADAPSLIPRLHFESGSDQLQEEAVHIVQKNIAWLHQHPEKVLVLEGHCDERGSDRVNMELGDRRARRVKAYVMTQGIEADRTIMVVSQGERRPLDPRHVRDAWRQNRRVEFLVR